MMEQPRDDADATAARPQPDGREAFAAGLRWLVAEAARTAVTSLVFVDADFAEWPLGERSVVDDLTAWARPGRHLLLLGHDYGEMPRRHPRFVVWRRTWAHLVEARAAIEVDRSEFPTLALAGSLGLLLQERRTYRGRWLDEANDRKTWREVVDAITQRSEVAFPPDALGL